MAVLFCEACGNIQPFYQIYQPIIRDAYNRIVSESGWSFNPETGRCTADTSDRSRQNLPYAHMCFNCNRRAAWVYSSEPPTAAPTAIGAMAGAIDASGDESVYVWSTRREARVWRALCFVVAAEGASTFSEVDTLSHIMAAEVLAELA
ncbi:hypothetical protein PM082_015980 [Marasmius tenuissimus]|nr:hypothetical protein PM082_015980 [Marasmius tenuissimus]